MAMMPSDSSHHGIVENSPYRTTQGRNEDTGELGASWYFSRKEIEENSPSRRDGIDLKKESYLRKSYCTFLQDLGMRLKVPQVTIATAIVFCHRFYLRQSHAKNDRRTIATVCMFLAGKVEETPRPLKDVILVSYEVIHKKDPTAGQKIKQREVYDQQKELILLGERVVLATLGFDLNVHHPYKPLVEAIRKFKVAQNALAQVAWNFVNDGLRTSLCLQFKPHHIAAGAIFLAAKFLKVKLPSDGERVWWQEFDVTPRQLEEVSNQMLELYEQNRAAQAQPSHGNEAEGSSASVHNQRVSVKAEGSSEETLGSQKMLQNDNGDHRSNKTRSNQSGSRVDVGANDGLQHDKQSLTENQNLPSHGNSSEIRDGNRSGNDGSSVTSLMVNRIDKDKVKAQMEKQRKLKGDVARKVDVIDDDDDDLERQLEHGVELAVEDDKIKQERKQNSSHVTTIKQEDHRIADQVTGNGHLSKQNLPETSQEAPMNIKKEQYNSYGSKHHESHDTAHERGERDYKRPRPEG
ncbi:cyclin-T1-4 [Oryza brachyantha]|uniref:Cyclin-like domain-containing protein n=1 Tax=Oryza brachyantha TaxID=4533 RepID=J3NDG8_ORYBR|nr:cyclin-T1-4 [Oryza brachyantha]XP_006664024.1 cyclin-T1-4 [Oryza brachyantha]